ncbi:MAG: PQQ-binding-like beta-propeller repeat protein, partial [Thermomicrobiales bacterium]
MSRFAVISTFGLVMIIVAVTAFLVRGGGTPSNPELAQYPEAAAQEPSTPISISTPLAMSSTTVTWELDPPLTHSGQEGPIAVSNGRAFQLVTFDSDDDAFDFSGVRAIDLESGEVLWQQEFEWSRPGLKADEHGVYSVVDLQTVVARAPDSGESFWTLDLSAPIASLALDDGVLYVWDANSRMSAVNTTTGKSMWQTDSVSDTPYETTPNGAPFSE